MGGVANTTYLRCLTALIPQVRVAGQIEPTADHRRPGWYQEGAGSPLFPGRKFPSHLTVPLRRVICL